MRPDWCRCESRKGEEGKAKDEGKEMEVGEMEEEESAPAVPSSPTPPAPRTETTTVVSDLGAGGGPTWEAA